MACTTVQTDTKDPPATNSAAQATSNTTKSISEDTLKLKKTKLKPMKDLEITQINLQHSNIASMTLQQNIESTTEIDRPHIVCVQEPLCNKKTQSHGHTKRLYNLSQDTH